MSRPCGFGTVTTMSSRTMNWCRPPEKGPSNPRVRRPWMSLRRGTGPHAASAGLLDSHDRLSEGGRLALAPPGPGPTPPRPRPADPGRPRGTRRLRAHHEDVEPRCRTSRRGASRTVPREAVLCGWGITEEGRKVLLHLAPGTEGGHGERYGLLRPRWTPENRPVVDGSKPASGVVSAPSTTLVPHWSPSAQERVVFRV
jgi:hypothetical protein